MPNRRSVTSHRAQIVEQATVVAEHGGVRSLTIASVAAAAELSEQAVRDEFATADALVDAVSAALAQQVTVAMRQSFADALESTDVAGLRGLRVLLHAALSGYWPVVEAGPDRRMLTFELTSYGLRHAESDVAGLHYRNLDDQAVRFLNECSRRTGTTWLEPVGAIARLALALLDGLLLRWLVDRRSDAMIAQLDDVAAIIAAKATE